MKEQGLLRETERKMFKEYCSHSIERKCNVLLGVKYINLPNDKRINIFTYNTKANNATKIYIQLRKLNLCQRHYFHT